VVYSGGMDCKSTLIWPLYVYPTPSSRMTVVHPRTNVARNLVTSDAPDPTTVMVPAIQCWRGSVSSNLALNAFVVGGGPVGVVVVDVVDVMVVVLVVVVVVVVMVVEVVVVVVDVVEVVVVGGVRVVVEDVVLVEVVLVDVVVVEVVVVLVVVVVVTVVVVEVDVVVVEVVVVVVLKYPD
jgi:hypothetical protein